MGKSVIQRMYMEYIKEKIMNEQERALDLQLGDALAELESLKAERDALKANRDEYQVAADKLAMENKILRDTKSFDILQESVEYNELKIEFQNYRNEMREEVVSLEKERDALKAQWSAVSKTLHDVSIANQLLIQAAQAGLDALDKCRIVVDDEGNKSKEVTPKVITKAIKQLQAALGDKT
tara:strand:+ start:548 stop:1090 length:543 start_codon:yes stop_codon:yes gene_type:complete